MKQCPNCSAKNQDDAAFCENCGADIRNVAATPGGPAAGSDFLKKAGDALSSGAKKAREAAEAGAQKFQQAVPNAGGFQSSWGGAGGAGSMLVDQSETIMATIGSNYLQNYLSGGGVSKGIGILTQKRFYYKGRNFSGMGKSMSSTTQEGVVSLDDIAFTQFTFTRHIGLLIFAILLTVAGLALLPLEGIGVIGLIASIPFYILYFVKRQTLFMVSFPGGGFAFDVRWYPISDIRDFQRQLHLLKDHRKEN